MNGFDYIRIRGFETTPGTGGAAPDPGLYEIFQGIGGGTGGDGTAPQTPISNDHELSAELWEAQNERLRAENAYCDQLQNDFKHKQQANTSNRDHLVDAAKEVLERIIGGVVGATVTGFTGSPLAGWLASTLTEMAVSWCLDYIEDLLTRGHALLDGIKAENQALLRLEPSRKNYEYREQVLARHREDIRMILDQLRQAEKDLADLPGMDIAPLLQALQDLRLQNVAIEGPGGRTQILQGGVVSDNDALAVEG